MGDIDRRGFVSAGALGLVGMLPGQGGGAGGGRTSGGSKEEPTEVTRTLAAYAVNSKPDGLPAGVRAEACRTLLNWAGCTVGGSRHETVDITLRALARFAGPAHASVLGRRERMDILHTALVNGISSHVLDFDDTH